MKRSKLRTIAVGKYWERDNDLYIVYADDPAGDFPTPEPYTILLKVRNWVYVQHRISDERTIMHLCPPIRGMERLSSNLIGILKPENADWKSRCCSDHVPKAISTLCKVYEFQVDMEAAPDED